MGQQKWKQIEDGLDQVTPIDDERDKAMRHWTANDLARAMPGEDIAQQLIAETRERGAATVGECFTNETKVA